MWPLHCLRPFPRLALPSLSPAEYAANNATPLAAYNALFDSLAALRARRSRQRATPALIFIDPRDELVSYRGLRAMSRRPEGRLWKLVTIRRSLRKDRRDYHHLVIDPASVGAERWGEIVRHIREFLARLGFSGDAPASRRVGPDQPGA
jgi:hypothetical protein